MALSFLSTLLSYEEVEKPAPKDDEVLVEVSAASLNALDWRIMSADPFIVRLMGMGLFRPRVQRLGADFAGRVQAVGKLVDDLKPGDEVFGSVGEHSVGALAEYVCAKAATVTRKPANLSFEQAAAIPVAGVTALQGLRDVAQLEPGQRVLVNGASSGVGIFAVQIAKHRGAQVTGVCSGAKADVVRAVGADQIIDYTQQEFSDGSQRYDLIFDVAMFKPVRKLARALAPGGSYVVAGGSVRGLFKIILFGWLFGLIWRRRFRAVSAITVRGDLQALRELAESEALEPYIDKHYPLAQAADAIRYLQQRRARGKVVVVV